MGVRIGMRVSERTGAGAGARIPAGQRPASRRGSTLRSAVASALAAMAVMVPAPAFAEAHELSIDCDAATGGALVAICDSATLSFLDVRMDRAIAALPAMSPRRAEQEGWLARRDECGPDEACLTERYLDRLAALVPQPDGFALLGRYEGGSVGGSSSAVLVPEGDGVALFARSVTAPFYHSCEFSGVMARNDGFVDPSGSLLGLSYLYEEADRCTIDLTGDGRSVVLGSVGCSEYCGARGSLGGSLIRVD